MRGLFSTLVALALALAWPSGLLGAQQALGANGTVYRLLDDSYGALFAGGNEAPDESRVLALEIIEPGGRAKRLLVPQTQSRGAELAPNLVYDHSSDTLFLLWEGIFNDLHPLLYLASFTQGAWGEVLEITGDPFARKGRPQLVVTRDVVGRGSPEADRVRTTLHIVWWEETAGGARKRYAPIVIEGGSNQRSWHPTWDLASFGAVHEGGAIREHAELVSIVPGPRSESVLIGFLTTSGDRLVTLESEVLASALSELADSARFHILNDGLLAGGREALADSVGAFIRGSDLGFHDASLAFLAESARQAVLDTRIPYAAAADLADLADSARFHILNDGVRIDAHGLAEDDAFDLIEIERLDHPDTYHRLKVSVLADRPAPPQMGPDAHLFLSVDGRNAILCWVDANAVVYVVSAGDDWGPEQRLVLDASSDLESAYEMLQALARSR